MSLLRRYLEVMIDKGPVRTSDWGAEELSAEQIDYAAADVIHLLDLHVELTEQLDSLRLKSLFDQVCAYMPIDAHLEVMGVPNPLNY